MILDLINEKKPGKTSNYPNCNLIGSQPILILLIRLNFSEILT